MKLKPQTKYGKIAAWTLLVIVITLILIFLLFRTQSLSSGWNALMIILRPVIYGFAIAFLLNPFMQLIENGILTLVGKTKAAIGRRIKMAIRIFCSLLIVVLVIGVIILIIAKVLPELINSIRGIIASIPTYVENIQTWYSQTFNNDTMDAAVVSTMENVGNTITDWFNNSLTPQVSDIISSLSKSVLQIVLVLKDLFIGLCISVYVMCVKESIKARFKRLVYALFSITAANQVIRNFRFIDQKFGGFIIGKLIDSLIIGIICYVCMLIMRMPYAVLLSIIIGVTNIIPFFGPFIGAIPSAILIFFVNPLQALYFIIFIIILQQFDGNLLGPKILGDSVGISSFLVLVAIVVGSGFFGVLGMIIGVPIFAIAVALIQTYVLRSAIKKDIPKDLETYRTMWQLDPETREPVEKPKTFHKLSLYESIKKKSEKVRGMEMPVRDNPWDQTEDMVRDGMEMTRISREAEEKWKKEKEEKTQED